MGMRLSSSAYGELLATGLERKEIAVAARAIWKGVLKIGTNKVPVKLYSAVQDRSVHFHILDTSTVTCSYPEGVI
jgi:hypothetical protein